MALVDFQYFRDYPGLFYFQKLVENCNQLKSALQNQRLGIGHRNWLILSKKYFVPRLLQSLFMWINKLKQTLCVCSKKVSFFIYSVGNL